MEPIGIIVTENSATMIMGGKPVTIPSSHKNFEAIYEKLLNQEYDGLQELINPEAELKAVASSEDKVSKIEVRYGEAYYDGRRIDGKLGKKLVQELERGHPMPGFVNFVEKLYQNPSKRAVDELYLFIESGYVAIHPDGDILAYKKVRNDFKDIYTGTMDNSPGQIVEMPRNGVDEDRDRTCSPGLHFCTYSYLKHYGWYFGGYKVVVVKINPADVVAIPSDYNNAKGRTCRYEVLQEVEDWRTEDYLDKVDPQVFADYGEDSWDYDEDED